MKCNLFELTYLPDNTKIWSNADEFLTLIQSNGQATTSYDTYPPFLSKQVSEAEFDTKGTLIVFCFTENTKIIHWAGALPTGGRPVFSKPWEQKEDENELSKLWYKYKKEMLLEIQ